MNDRPSSEAHEICFEYAPHESLQVRRASNKHWYLPSLVGLGVPVLVVLPSLAALYWGGYRIVLYIVAAVFALLLLAGGRAAARRRRQDFAADCAPMTIRWCEDWLELDSVIDWKRLGWSFVRQAEVVGDWVRLKTADNEPIAIPPRAFSAVTREEFVADIRVGIDSNRELTQHRTFDEPAISQVSFVFDQAYRRRMLALRWASFGGNWTGRFTRMAVPIALAVLACLLWKEHWRLIAGAAAAVLLPAPVWWSIEAVMMGLVTRRSLAEADLRLDCVVHSDGLERRCGDFQTYASWLLYADCRLAEKHLLLATAHGPTLLIPPAAFNDNEETARVFYRQVEGCRRAVHEEVDAIDEERDEEELDEEELDEEELDDEEATGRQDAGDREAGRGERGRKPRDRQPNQEYDGTDFDDFGDHDADGSD